MHPNPESVPPPTFYGSKDNDTENGKRKDKDKDKSDDKDQSDKVSKSEQIV